MKHISMYTTPTCTYCEKAKELFKEFNIDYSEYNVVGDKEKLQEMMNLSGQMGVPTFYVGGEIKVGYDEKWLLGVIEEQKKAAKEL